jgi:hypothetical protein
LGNARETVKVVEAFLRQLTKLTQKLQLIFLTRYISFMFIIDYEGPLYDSRFAPFFLHIDEFQNISTPSIAAILSEARKYKLGLTVAHQFIAQLDPVIRDAVFGNVGSMAAFRVGTDDAVELESQFAPVFSANDIMNTPNYNAIVRVLANGVPTPPFSVATLPPPPSDPSIIQGIIQQSYAKYGRPREEIEEEIRLRYQKPVPPVPRADGIL